MRHCWPSLILAGWTLSGGLPAPAQSSRGERPVPPVPMTPSSSGNGQSSGASRPASAPPRPAPLRLPPGVPPLGLPSDGEPAPAFPDMPDWPDPSPPMSLLPPIEGSAGAAEAVTLPPATGAPFSPDGVEEVPLPVEGELFPLPGETSPPPVTPVPGETAPPPPRPAAPTSPAATGSAPTPFRAPTWHRNPKATRDLAVSEQKCFLLVFTNQTGEAGGATYQLNHEVFASQAFNEYALEHLVLCNLDYSRRRTTLDPQEQYRLEEALESVKKAFKVRGFPTVILFGPDEKEITRWAGFRSGRGPTYFQNLKAAVDGHEAMLFAGERRRERLTTQGYREWRSAHGTTLFAKLVEFDARMAVLRDESGVSHKVLLPQLAITDREVITRLRLGLPMPKPAPRATAASGQEATLR